MRPCTASLLLALFACRGGPTVDVQGEGPEARREALARVELDIAKRYDDVRHIDASALEQQAKTLLVDVREPSEYAVARLAGAIRVDPSMSSGELLTAIGPRAEGADVVFYCSVGERSSKMARRAKKSLESAGARSIANLRGGIFAWHNESRPLVNDEGPTAAVHPFNDKWGELLVHREKLSRTPVKLTK